MGHFHFFFFFEKHTNKVRFQLDFALIPRFPKYGDMNTVNLRKKHDYYCFKTLFYAK